MKYVAVTEQDDVTLVTICREEALNALNIEVLSELEQAFECIDIDKIRCVILTGAGKKAFAAGADINIMQHFTKEEGKAFSTYGQSVMRKIETFPIPVIAAINGYALGGGCELALACDIRIASDNAVLGLPETGIGVLPGFGGSQRLHRLIPMGKAKELLYTAGRVNADEAEKIGLLNTVCTQDKLLEQALILAKKIARNAPIGVRAAKRAVNEGEELSLAEGMILEAELFASCFKTEDQVTGMTAFLEKRDEKRFVNR